MYLRFKDLVKLDKASRDIKWPGFQAIGRTATISGELLTKLPASLITVLLLALGKCLKRQPQHNFLILIRTSLSVQTCKFLSYPGQHHLSFES